MAVESLKIKKIEDLLKPILNNGSKVLRCNTKNLTANGDNYGSLLVSIEVTLHNNETSTEETKNIVAKLFPNNEWLKRMFASEITFKKEIGFYMEIVPTLIKFQKEHNIPEENLFTFFPKCVNARLNLNSTCDQVDEDAILLLENLRLAGYKILNRLIGFNLEETEIVLKNLARFHAVPLAYKIKHYEDFQTKLMPLLNRVFIGREMFNKFADRFTDSVAGRLNLNEEELKRFAKGMARGYDFQKNFPSGKEQYATMVHCDFWLNNTMLKHKNDKPIDNKMIDFQVVTFGAPASDVVFFLFTSVHLETLEKYFDHFLQIYHREFVDCLRELHCDVTEYTFQSFLEEINTYASLEVSHILIMFKAVFSEGRELKIEDMELEDMFKDHGITNIYKNRLTRTVKMFLDKNWF